MFIDTCVRTICFSLLYNNHYAICFSLRKITVLALKKTKNQKTQKKIVRIKIRDGIKYEPMDCQPHEK